MHYSEQPASSSTTPCTELEVLAFLELLFWPACGGCQRVQVVQYEVTGASSTCQCHQWWASCDKLWDRRRRDTDRDQIHSTPPVQGHPQPSNLLLLGLLLRLGFSWRLALEGWRAAPRGLPQ